MSTSSQLLYSFLHGTAMRYAAEQSPSGVDPKRRKMADGCDDLLTGAAGID
jgi:hypothetical protein